MSASSTKTYNVTSNVADCWSNYKQQMIGGGGGDLPGQLGTVWRRREGCMSPGACRAQGRGAFQNAQIP